MNRYYVLSGILIAMLLLSSCAEEEKGLPVDVQVNFIPSISYMESVTRAFDGSWENNDRIGIYMIPHVANPSDPADFNVYTSDTNVQYKTSTGGALAPLAAISYGIGYPANNDAVNFVGYYPYQSTLHSVENDIYKINVATQSPAKDIDLLYHKGTGIPYQGTIAGNVSLEFEHQLSKLIVSVEPASAAVIVDLSTATSSLTGFPTAASFDLSTGTVNSLSGADVTLTPNKNTAGSSTGLAVFTALLVPHDDGSTYNARTIKLSIDGQTYNYVLPVNHPFGSGLAYSYKFKYTGTDIVLSDNTIVGWEGNTVIGDMITVDRNNIELAGDINKGTTTIIGNAIKVATTSTKPLSFELSDDENSITTHSKPDWINATLSSGSTGADGLTHYELSFDPESNPDNAYRTGYIHLVANGLTTVIRVNQGIAKTNIANSYMVLPGGSVTIPIERAITISGMGADEPFTIERLWDDNNVYNGYSVSGTGRDREITVTTNNNRGNAFIVLKYDGLVYWSWHLWVSDYDCSTTWTNNGFEMMDRNLGSIAAENSLDGRGLFYQWGRKDPFQGSGTAGGGEFHVALRPEKSGDNDLDIFRNYLLFIIRNAGKYIQEPGAGVAGGYGWYWPISRDHDKYLWCTEDSKKTIYDPCPSGWMVPMTTEVWAGVTATTYTSGPQGGMDFGPNGLFPATGMRERLKYSHDGHVGYYWCGKKTPNIVCFFFQSGMFSLFSSQGNAAGMPVRCVKE